MFQLQKLIPKKKTPKLVVEEVESHPTHVHTWEVIGKTHARPRRDVKAEGYEKETLEKALFGVTTFVLQCAKCSEIRTKEVIGSDEDNLDELMDKAEEHGPQYIERGENTFVLGKWTPQQQSVNNIPLK